MVVGAPPLTTTMTGTGIDPLCPCYGVYYPGMGVGWVWGGGGWGWGWGVRIRICHYS